MKHECPKVPDIAYEGRTRVTRATRNLLGILMHPDNRDLPFPVILTGPKHAAPYLQTLFQSI